jgi:hypothetical protein
LKISLHAEGSVVEIDRLHCIFNICAAPGIGPAWW